ncbi:MAG: PKD domain-containing protein [Solirubrobacterales bacterium]
MLGVDPGDGSVYTGDVTPDGQSYRIQKFSSSGSFEASVLVPRVAEEKVFTLHGIAVDPSLHRFYVIEGCRLAKPAGACKSFSLTFGARRILVFSTEPSGTALVPAPTATLPLPTGEEALYSPQSIAVDPSNHDLVILAENMAGHTIVQRISSAGVAGVRYVDSSDVLRSPGEEANALTVGPDGTTYTLTGGPSAPGAAHTRAWQLPADLSQLEAVPGFARAAEEEDWTTGLLDPRSSAFMGGPQVTISPDGSTLYWKESLAQSTPSEPGEVLIRGFSLGEERTKVVYGGGSSRCAIDTSEAGIAATGENLVAFDYGPEVDEEGTEPPYGNRVITFGPGGTGCPVPTAKLKVNGSSEPEVTVAAGATVSFDASESELFEAEPVELDWKFGDGSEQKVVGTPEEDGEPALPPETTITHKYSTAGTYTVELTVKLENSTFGQPAPITRTVHVQSSGPGQFNLTVSKSGSGGGTVSSLPAGINCGLVCSHAFDEGTKVTLTATPATGSQFKGWGGACIGTGSCEVTMSAARAVTASFEPATTAGGGGGTSGGGGGSGGSTPPPGGGTPPPPAPAPKPKLTPRQRALAKCKKLKGKARAKCVRKAKAIGKHKGSRRSRAGR